MVPHTYKHLDSYVYMRPDQQLVIDSDSHSLGYYQLCSDPDLGLARQPMTRPWDYIRYVDLKIHGTITPHQLADLQDFLNNNQRQRFLHLAAYDLADISWLGDVTWLGQTVLDLHDYLFDLASAHDRFCLVRQLTAQQPWLFAEYHWQDRVFYNLLEPHAAKLTI